MGVPLPPCATCKDLATSGFSHPCIECDPPSYQHYTQNPEMCPAGGDPNDPIFTDEQVRACNACSIVHGSEECSAAIAQLREGQW